MPPPGELGVLYVCTEVLKQKVLSIYSRTIYPYTNRFYALEEQKYVGYKSRDPALDGSSINLPATIQHMTAV